MYCGCNTGFIETSHTNKGNDMSKYAVVEFNGMFRVAPGMTGNSWNKVGSRRLALFSNSADAHAALAATSRHGLMAVCRKKAAGWYTVVSVCDTSVEVAA